MQYRHLGSTGLRVSAVSLGSWLTYGNTVGQDQAGRIVHSAFDAGVNLFDTADVYNRGEGEKALGRALGSLPRQRLVIASKCFFPMSDDDPNDRGLSRKHVHESLVRSLARLGTDYLDLYQCHRPDPDTPLAETCRAMDDLIRQGKVLYWGVSMWPADLIAEAVTFCTANGLHPPVSNQPVYNLLDRRIEDRVIPTGERLGVGQIVFSPLAEGVLTGKYRPGEAPPADSRAGDERINRFIGRFLTDDAVERAGRMARLAADAGITPAQLALAFCLRVPDVASTIVGARTVEQLEDNLGAAEIELSDDLRTRLDELFPA